MANIFKKPEDETEFGQLSKEEQEKYLDELSKDLEDDDEKAIIWAALKTFVPPVVVGFVILYVIATFLFS